MFKKIGIFLVALVSYTNAQPCEQEVEGYVTFWYGKLNMWTDIGGQWQHEAIEGPGSASPMGSANSMGECMTDSEDKDLVQFGSPETWGDISNYCNSKYEGSGRGEGKLEKNIFYDAERKVQDPSEKCVYECVKCVEPPAVDCCNSDQWEQDDCFGPALTNQICCKAMTATCRACQAGVSPHEYCQKCFIQGCKIAPVDPASLSKAYRSLGQCGR